MTTTGNLALNSLGSMTLTGNITSGAGTQTYTGPVILSSQAIVLTSTNAAIAFSGITSSINGAQNLTIASGTGAITLGSTLGDSTPIGALSLTSSTSINIGGNITNSSTQTFTGPVVLTADSVISTVASAATGNTISFTSTINGTTNNTESLTLNSGTTGTVGVSGIVGGSATL
jgi:hypothetical protein